MFVFSGCMCLGILRWVRILLTIVFENPPVLKVLVIFLSMDTRIPHIQMSPIVFCKTYMLISLLSFEACLTMAQNWVSIVSNLRCHGFGLLTEIFCNPRLWVVHSISQALSSYIWGLVSVVWTCDHIGHTIDRPCLKDRLGCKILAINYLVFYLSNEDLM